MKLWLTIPLKLMLAGYFLLTSIYCVLAIPPYTYYALIKAPPYDWVSWFASHHVALFWIVWVVSALAYWPGKKTRIYLVCLSVCGLLGIALTLNPFMASVQGNRSTFVYAIVALIPPILWAGMEIIRLWPESNNTQEMATLGYLVPVLTAGSVALLSAAGVQLCHYRNMTSSGASVDPIRMPMWSILIHLTVVLTIVSSLNLLKIFGNKIRFGRVAIYAVVLLAVCCWLSLGTSRFLQNSLDFPHEAAIIYSLFLSLMLTLFGLSLAMASLINRPRQSAGVSKPAKFAIIGVICFIAVLALVLPSYVGIWDWNGLFQSMFSVLLWITVLICCGLLLPHYKQYSLPAVLAIAIIAGAVYEGFKYTEIVWAKPLGATDDEISRKMEEYASQDFSFALVSHFLGNEPKAEPCNDLCRILKQYTNIPNFHLGHQVNLVKELAPVSGNRPNIFVFVIDSMRPDYLGAYNHAVDFTPNLDAFARDSVVFRRAYTQYAGTTLSEPAIWSGAMLLHTHYTQPFSNVNNLEKLVSAENYKMVVSYDTVLRQVLSPSDDLARLDTDKSVWNNYEACSTIHQLTDTLDARADKTRPVFFYSQPMNVHQFARNGRPPAGLKDWHRPGFNPRISLTVNQVDTCLGGFFSYLKQRGMYDDSIVIVTSDHGDATGEYGRISHALMIYPEIMRVPLIIHLPKSMQDKFIHNENEFAALTDITPSLDYLLGHHALQHDPVFGHTLFAETGEELQRNARHELFLASDVLAVYGILAEDGRYLYTTYASPAKSELFDLSQDPNAQQNILTPALKRQYDQRVIDYLKMVGDFYGFKPGVTSFLASAR